MKISSKKRPYIPLLIVGLLIVGLACVVFFFLKPKPTPSQPIAPLTPVDTSQAPQSLLLPGAKTAIPLPIDKSLLTRPDGQLILVNKAAPIDLSYVPHDLVLPEVPYRTDKSQEEVMVRSALAQPLQDMFAAAKAAGHDLMIGSAYRSSALQEMYFNNYARTSGQAEAEKYSAHPGTSEHQLGLAVDLTTIDRVCYLAECFESTEAGKWLASNAHRYGFILRYPKGKTDETGYNYEPWHFRFLSTSIATAVYESNLTYEEAFPYLAGEKQP